MAKYYFLQSYAFDSEAVNSNSIKTLQDTNYAMLLSCMGFSLLIADMQDRFQLWLYIDLS